MASVVFDPRRGSYSIQWFDGQRWVREPVCRLPNWKRGAKRPKSDPLEVDRAKAAFKAREQAVRLKPRRERGQSVAAFLEGYLAEYRYGRTAGSAKQMGQAVRWFLAWCAEQSPPVVRLDSVTDDVCTAWLRDRSRQRSVKTGRFITHDTLKKERSLLSGAWNAALKLKQVDANPWKLTELPTKPVSKRRGSWSPEDYRRLMAASRTWLRDLIALGCHSGLRISALLGLEWRDVRDGTLTVRPELDKAGKGYTLPVHRVVAELVERRRVHQTCPRVITGHRGKPSRITTAATGILRACKRAGLPKPDSPTHHMRRTFGRWAVLGHLTGQPVPIYVVSKWMGHSTVEMTEKYLQLEPHDSSSWMAGNASFGHPRPSQ